MVGREEAGVDRKVEDVGEAEAEAEGSPLVDIVPDPNKIMQITKVQAARQQQTRHSRQRQAGHRNGGSHLAARPATAGQTQPMQDSSAIADHKQDLPDCVICCEPMQVVSIGKCNHKAVCERCSLRLIMLYQDTRCPLCKADLEQVVMAQWTDPEPHDWPQYASRLRQLWHNPKWCRSIFVDDAPVPGVTHTRNLHSRLQHIAARACVVCDPQGHRPFPSNSALTKHVMAQHHQHMCTVCLDARRSFALELPLFASQKELQAHMTSAHTFCGFCNVHFFSGEELWEHVHDRHFTCQLCMRHSTHSHFNAAADLTEHLRRDHFLCIEEECQDCFVAFDSLQQLQEHHRDFHSHRMPRWDPSRARHVPLSEIFPALGLSHDRPTGPGARRDRQGGRRGPARGRLEAAADGPSQAPHAHQGGPASAEAAIGSHVTARQGEGGMMMIDDDFPPMGDQSGLLPSPVQAVQPARQGTAFPDLAAAAATSGSEPALPMQPRQRREARPLVKVTVKCPCGRKTSHQVVQEGQRAAALCCDAACVQAGRQQQLAGAFGVEDPAHHVSSFDRNRTPTYSSLLLTHAWSNKEWVQGIERQLASFLSAKGSKRHSLPAMPRHQREVVHALAEQYGMASSSYKPEPQRYVELFKLPASSVPNKLLSEAVKRMTHEDIISLARAEHGHPMKLIDLAQDVDVEWFLKQWDGQYNTEWQSRSEVIVRFTNPQALKEALTALGGGIRGVFRVDRGWGPSGLAPQAAPASSTPAAAASSSRHSSSSSQAPESSDWQTVKTSGTKPKGRRPGPSQANAPAPAYASASPLDFQEPWRDDAGSSDDHSADSANQRRLPKHRSVVMPVVTEELPEDWEEAASATDAAEEGAEAATEAAAVTKGLDHAAPGATAQSDASAAPTDALGQQPVPTVEANASSEQQHGAAVSVADDAGAAAEQAKPGSDTAADEAGLRSSVGGAAKHDGRAAEGTEGNVAFGEGDTGLHVDAAGDKHETAVGTEVQPPVSNLAEATVSVQVGAAQPESISASLQGRKEDLAGGHESDDYLPGQQLQSDSGNGVASTFQGEMAQGEQRAVALHDVLDGEPVGSCIQSNAGSSPRDVGEEIVWMQDSIANTVQAGSHH
ncbi:hypothetical protein WJX77_004297 [Trebouxia sp. C0004]